MNRKELITQLQMFGVDKIYRNIDDASKVELESIFASLINPKTKHYSYTQISMYQRCGLQYFFRYIRGIKIPPMIIATRNKVIHDVIAEDLKHKRETGELLPINYKKEMYSEKFYLAVQEEEPVIENTTFEAEVLTGNSVIQLEHQVAQNIFPIEVETEVEYELDGKLIKGVIDVISPDGIRDHKIKTRSMPKKEVEYNSQLALYSEIKGIEDTALDIYVTTKTPKYEIIKTTMDEKKRKYLIGKMKLVINAIESNIFVPCDPSNWVCSPEWCGYWYLCMEEI